LLTYMSGHLSSQESHHPQSPYHPIGPPQTLQIPLIVRPLILNGHIVVESAA
jgi:hypothetical protein